MPKRASEVTRQTGRPDLSTAFRVAAPPSLVSGVVFSSPHSGRFYLPEFIERSRLELQALRASEDAFVDELFAQVI
ncbi:MAG: N-formylglutamate amidohydrolase, partial [Pseudomonadota bacterium]